MPDPLFSPAAPDFTDPLGLLAACHGRIRSHCALLERMLAWLPTHGADDEIRRSAQRVIHYFETAGRHHHADEEDDLFPLLAGSPALDATLAQLRREHRELDALWQDLARRLEQLGSGEVPADLGPLAQTFVAAQSAHIGIEDAQLLPAARALLGPAQIASLGHAMARRRGVTPKAAD